MSVPDLNRCIGATSFTKTCLPGNNPDPGQDFGFYNTESNKCTYQDFFENPASLWDVKV